MSTPPEIQVRPPSAASALIGRAAAAATGPGTPGRRGSTLVRHLTVAAILVALGVGLSYLLPSFRNYQLALVLMYLCATAGLTVLIGLNGQISLGHGAIMAVGGYTTGFVQNYLGTRFINPPAPGAVGFSAVTTVQSWTIFVSILVGILAATAAGLVIGLAAARLRGPYLAGATLTLVGIVGAVTTTFLVFNGNQGIRVKVPSTPIALKGFVTSDQWQVWVTLGFAALTLVLLANLMRSRIGREFRAVRDDEIAAQISGIPVARTQIVAFVVSAAAAGLAGGLTVFLTWNAQPGAYGLVLSLNLVLAIVLGGLGSLAGAAWGALLLVLIPHLTELLTHRINGPPELTQKLLGNLPLLIFGLTLIAVTLFAPGGIQNLVRRIGAGRRVSR